jgi:pSer/pThr/pTyr-binding forkhead associated (FHA) protein
MALVLEELDARRGEAVVRRIVVEAREVTFGRALDNDIVIEDPYVDGHHARLVVEPDGALVLTDLGSRNGLELAGGGRVPRIALAPGLTIRVGRTRFRVRDLHAPVPEALPLPVETLTGRWIERPAWAAALAAGTVAVAAAETWTGATSRDAGTETLAAIVMVVIVLALWAGGWTALGRVLTRRAGFLIHVAIASLVTLAWSATETVARWSEFLFPAHWTLWTTAEGFAIVGIVLLGMVAHLSYATLLRPRTRWVSVAAVTIGVSVIVLAFDAVKDEGFSDVPEYTATIRHAPASLIPTTTTEAFAAAAAEMREAADKAAREAERKTAGAER